MNHQVKHVELFGKPFSIIKQNKSARVVPITPPHSQSMQPSHIRLSHQSKIAPSKRAPSPQAPFLPSDHVRSPFKPVDTLNSTQLVITPRPSPTSDKSSPSSTLTTNSCKTVQPTLKERIKQTVSLLKNGTSDGMAKAARVLWHLSVNEPNFIDTAGALNALAMLIQVAPHAAKETGALAISDLARNPANQVKIAHTKGILPELVKLLKSESSSGKEVALQALGNLACCSFNAHAMFSTKGLVSELVKLLQSGSRIKTQQAVFVLANIACNNDHLHFIGKTRGAISSLIRLLEFGSPIGQKLSAFLLSNLSCHDSIQVKLSQTNGAILGLTKLLRTELQNYSTYLETNKPLCNQPWESYDETSVEKIKYAARALWHLSINAINQNGFATAYDGIPTLIKLLSTFTIPFSLKDMAIQTLINLANNHEQNKKTIKEQPGIGILLQIEQTRHVNQLINGLNLPKNVSLNRSGFLCSTPKREV